MARSSGGGSSSGGSRSSSRSSSSSRSHGSSGSSIRRTNHYFPGARKFRYYKDGTENYVYSNVDLTKQKDAKPRWFFLIFYIPFFLAIPMVWSGVFNFKQQPMTTINMSEVCVIDDGDYFEEFEEQQLLETLMQFSSTTGITTKIVTVPYEEWINGGSLENYSLSRYYMEFDDETGWILTYSSIPQYPNRWFWEGVQGDDTIDVMSPFLEDFNSTLQSQLLSNNEPNVAESFSVALKHSIDIFENQKFSINWVFIFPSLFFTGFIFLHAGIMVFAGTRKKYSYSELEEIVEYETNNNEFACSSNLKTCPYCGFSDVNMDICPNCGARI